ncbi:MAG: hypothetical protein HQL37_00580 [Alphaproteobacteria bacterium]|nr:hypothetical protein [Alphaproteobacteria bacterium]
MSRKYPALALAALALVISQAASAQQSGGVHVTGDTTIDVSAKNVSTLASGTGNTAVTNIGAITEDTTGKTSVAVSAKNIENVVSGHGKKGCVSIASQGGC